MKRTLTLLSIASVILISVSCQKDDLPVTSTSAAGLCPSTKKVLNSGAVNLGSIGDNKQIQNAVACKACHAYREAVVQ